MEVEFVSYDCWNKLPQIQGLCSVLEVRSPKRVSKMKGLKPSCWQEEALEEKMFSHHFQCLQAACNFSLRVPLVPLFPHLCLFLCSFSFPHPSFEDSTDYMGGLPRWCCDKESACQCRRCKRVQSLGRKDALECEKATHSSILD